MRQALHHGGHGGHRGYAVSLVITTFNAEIAEIAENEAILFAYVLSSGVESFFMPMSREDCTSASSVSSVVARVL
jgi:hypothetical protein